MAVDYVLYARCSLTTEEARMRLSDLAHLEVNAYGLGVRDGLTLHVSEADLEVERTQERFGFRPTVSATFRPETDAARDTYFTDLRLMLEAAAHFVVEQDATAVLLVTGGTILFQRLGEVLELNNEYAEWLSLGIADAIAGRKTFSSLTSPLVVSG